MTTLEQSFTAWADREFGPAPDPTIPQTERFASYWKCWQAAQPQRTGNAIRDAFAAMNQCDGCAAGMQVNYMGNHVGADGRPHMRCTSDRYEQSADSSTHQPNGATPQATAAGINSPHNACMHRHYCRALESKAQGRTVYLSDPEMKDVRDELMRRIREEPGFGRGLMQNAGIIDASGKLTPLYGGEE